MARKKGGVKTNKNSKGSKRSKKSNNNTSMKNRIKTMKSRRMENSMESNNEIFGDDYDNLNCCMCGKKVNKTDTLIPRKCLTEHGQKAHGICQKCWWDKDKGFARENAPHDCPGCIKKQPLTKVRVLGVIDLTGDD